jgi:hypothetical protein
MIVNALFRFPRGSDKTMELQMFSIIFRSIFKTFYCLHLIAVVFWITDNNYLNQFSGIW